MPKLPKFLWKCYATICLGDGRSGHERGIAVCVNRRIFRRFCYRKNRFGACSSRDVSPAVFAKIKYESSAWWSFFLTFVFIILKPPGRRRWKYLEPPVSNSCINRKWRNSRLMILDDRLAFPYHRTMKIYAVEKIAAWLTVNKLKFIRSNESTEANLVQSKNLVDIWYSLVCQFFGWGKLSVICLTATVPFAGCVALIMATSRHIRRWFLKSILFT